MMDVFVGILEIEENYVRMNKSVTMECEDYSNCQAPNIA